MSIKIKSREKNFNPVTVELTFETRDQLAAFINVYANPGILSMANEHISFECEMVEHEMFQGLDSLITLDDIDSLKEYL